MRRSWTMLAAVALLATACAARRAPDTRELAFVYRNPDAQWGRYQNVLLEPVTLWRSGPHSLDAIPEQDLLRLVSDFEAALRRRLGAGLRVVREPSPGTLRLRLAITAVRAADPALDVLEAVGETWPARPDGPLSP